MGRQGRATDSWEAVSLYSSIINCSLVQLNGRRRTEPQRILSHSYLKIKLAASTKSHT